VFGKRKNEDPAPAKPQPLQVEPPAVKAEVPSAPEETTPADIPNFPSLKEPPMARSPFAPPPVPAASASIPARATITSTPAARDTAERRTLVVGRGISVQGTVQDAERLVVEGTVEANSINGLTELSIAQGGVFKGEVEVEEAEIAGTIDGTLVARQTLVVRSTGRVLGTARCRRLQVEDGGQITGRIEMMTETSTPAEIKASV
jgi:cytoskeletal protein CcmA (bactofilin family)